MHSFKATQIEYHVQMLPYRRNCHHPIPQIYSDKNMHIINTKQKVNTIYLFPV